MTFPRATLDDLCEINVGRTPARAVPEFWGPGHPWLSIADMNQGRRLTHTKEQITDAGAKGGKLVEPGTVVLSFKLSIGKVATADIPLYTNEAIAALPIKRPDLIEGPYLARALEAIDLAAGSNRAAMGATLNKASLRLIQIPLPTLNEQRRIAAILDGADAIRRSRAESLRQFAVLRQAIFANLFPAGETVLTRPLQAVVREGTIVTYGIVQAGPEHPGGVPYIRTGDLADGEIKRDGLRLTHPDIAARFERSRVEVGDIVMSIRATVGTTAPVDAELAGANLTQGTARIAPGASVNGMWLLEFLRSPKAQRWIQSQVKGATFREITLGRLRDLPVPDHPLERQARFAHRVLEVAKRANASRLAADVEEDLFCSLQSHAFSGRL